MRPKASPLAVWAGLLVLYVVWGSTYLGMKVAIETMPPLVMGAFRFVPAGVLLVLVRRDPRPRRASGDPACARSATPRSWASCSSLGGTGLVAWAEQTIPTGVAAVVIALVPMWLAVLGFVLYRRAGPAAARASASRRPRRRRDPRLARGWRRRPRPGGPPRAPRRRPIFWALGTLYAARRAVLPGPALLASGHRDDRRRPRLRRRRGADRRAGRRSTSPPCRPRAGSASST